MTSLTVHEWLVYIPIFVDFSQIGAFTSWIEKEIKEEVFERVLDEIKKAQDEAWISPDFTTHVADLRGKINGFDAEISICFRLRTLCLEIRCWKTTKSKMQVIDAFENMKKAEEKFKNFIERWGTNTPTCNILVVKPFYAAENRAKNWVMDHLEDLKFFPTNCDIGSAFTLSLSKLIEKDEKLPFLVTSIRDNAGVQRKIILLCSEKARAPARSDQPCSYYRVRWVFFNSLVKHVLDRVNKNASLIAERIAKVEGEVLRKSHEPSKDKDTQWLMGMLRSVTEFSKQLSSLENELALISDDLVGVKRNLEFTEVTAGSNDIPKEPYKDEKICGNVDYISSGGEFGIGYGIFKGIIEEEARSQTVKCSPGYYCALCDTRQKAPGLTKKPPLKMGVMEETKKLIDYLIRNFRGQKSEIMRCMNRTKSFVSSLSSILSTQVNLSLDLSLSKTAIDQKEILSKVETILEEAEKDRKIAENATKTVEILSLLFASFVLGEISSNFIIWWLQQVWPTQTPWFAYLGGFLLALGIASIIFLSIYLGFLRKKWEKRL